MINKKRIRLKIFILKNKLAKTDYQAIKFAEGELSASEFAPIREHRRLWREEINQLEKQVIQY